MKLSTISKKILLLTAALAMALSTTAQTDLTKKERKAAVKAITSTYRTWDKVQIDGKVQTDLLPVSATLKIYMENDKMIDISARAPFVGEAFRMVITADSILVINKMKSTYASEGIADFMSVLPVGMSDLQDILLARVFVAGKGELSSRNADDCQMLSTEDSEYVILPPAITSPTVNYGFITNSDGKLQQFMAISEEKQLNFDSEFSYDFNQTAIYGSLVRGTRSVSATLSYPDPNFRPSSPKQPAIGKNYRKVSLRDVMRF